MHKAILKLILVFTLCTVGIHSHQAHHDSKEHMFDMDTGHLHDDIKEKYHLDMDTNKMNEDEQGFYYFDLHDFDKNEKLDGLEMLVSLNHQLDDPEEMAEERRRKEEAAKQPAYNPEDPHSYYEKLGIQKKWNEKYAKDAAKYDKNLDGQIDFNEFMQAKKAGNL